jgi:hypothetical protein
MSGRVLFWDYYKIMWLEAMRLVHSSSSSIKAKHPQYKPFVVWQRLSLAVHLM